jgi:hypothetical protein
MTKRKSQQPGWVYLLWCIGTQRFKIGYSGNVAQRAEAIESSSPYALKVVATKPGLVSDEQSLHHEFRAYRSHREWFDLPESAVWALLARFGINQDYAHAVAHLT